MSFKPSPCALPRTTTGHFRSIILTGAAGFGKSSVASELLPDAKVVRIPMATRNADTFGTYPFPKVAENGDVTIESPVCEKMIEPLFERNIGENYGILILDDITTGDERLQSAVLDIVQFHSIGEEKLGGNVLIVLTGNRSDDGCYAVEWSKALLGRCMVIEHQADFKKWLVHKDNTNTDPIVIAFLHDNPEYFAPQVSDEDSDKFIDELGVMPNPRDWTALGTGISDWGGWTEFEPNILYASSYDYVQAVIGKKCVSAFTVYANEFGILPRIEEILDNPSLWLKLSSEITSSSSKTMSMVTAITNYSVSRLNSDVIKNPEGLVNKAIQACNTVASENNEYILYFVSTLLNFNFKSNRTSNIVCSALFESIMGGELKNNEELQQLLADRKILKSDPKKVA